MACARAHPACPRRASKARAALSPRGARCSRPHHSGRLPTARGTTAWRITLLPAGFEGDLPGPTDSGPVAGRARTASQRIVSDVTEVAIERANREAAARMPPAFRVAGAGIRAFANQLSAHARELARGRTGPGRTLVAKTSARAGRARERLHLGGGDGLDRQTLRSAHELIPNRARSGATASAAFASTTARSLRRWSPPRYRAARCPRPSRTPRTTRRAQPHRSPVSAFCPPVVRGLSAHGVGCRKRPARNDPGRKASRRTFR